MAAGLSTDDNVDAEPFAADDLDDLACDPAAVHNTTDLVFGGSRFMFWALGPLSVCAGLSFLLTIEPAWSVATGVRLLLGLVCLLFALALLAPRRFDFCGRCVTAIVFALCVAYVIDEFTHQGAASTGPTRPGAATPANAIRAMLVFGLPSLWFTLRRRRQAREARPSSIEDRYA